MIFLQILAWSACCGLAYLFISTAIDEFKTWLRLRRAQKAVERAEIVRKNGARMLPENRHHL